MRTLPLIPYETLKKLISGDFTTKQIDYFIHLCKICDKNGVIKSKSMGALLEKVCKKDVYLLSRSSGYRAMAYLLKKDLLIKNKEGNIEIKGYKKAFQKGSKGLVIMPMFFFSMGFKKLSKIEKRIALYFIGQIRNLKKVKYFTINIQKLGTSFGMNFSLMHPILHKLKSFFDFSFFHEGRVCRASYRKEYLLSKEMLESMTKDFKEEYLDEKGEEIRNLIYKMEIEKLLLNRKKNLYLEEFKRYVVSRSEVDIKENIHTMIHLLYEHTNKEIKYILELLSSKLRQFSDPIMHLGAYLKTLIKENIRPTM